MKFSLVLYLFVLVFSTPLLAIEVTIDASKLKKVSPLYVSASGISSLIPESGVVTVNVAQLPDIVRLVERKKSRLITIRSIWILGDKLTLSGSVEENTIAVDADSQAALLPPGIEAEWQRPLSEVENPVSRPFLAFLTTRLGQYQEAELLQLMDKVSEEDKGFWAVEKIGEYLRRGESLGYEPNGNRFEYLTGMNKSGGLEKYQRPSDKYLLIDFSATACKPCLADIDQLVEIQKSFPEIEILSVWNDRRQDLWINTAAKQKNKITWTSLRDDTGVIFKGFDVNVFPTYMLFDKRGKLIKKWVGPKTDKISKYLEKG